MMKKMNGLREGRGATGEPSGCRPLKAAKLEGVRSFDEAGGGRPVSLAMPARTQRIMVKMPSTEPRVSFSVPNCSATDTMAREKIS